jgi:rhodanese-related sulfurtransferase
MTKEEFIQEVTDGLLPPPQYFFKNAKLNKTGYQSIDEVMEHGVQPLSVKEFEVLSEDDDILVLDVRSKEDFVEGFIPGTIFISLSTSFAPWVGALITDIKQKIILVTPVGQEEEAVLRLARVGYDGALGYLNGGISVWKDAGKEMEKIETISVEHFTEVYGQDSTIKILDVRKPGEWEATHISGAQHFALDYINDQMSEISPSNEYYVHCQSGNRSTIAASILAARGYKNLINVHGAFDVIKEAESCPVEGSCPSLIH